jgi:NUDIX domain
MQGNDRARKRNHLKRPTQRSLERRERRRRSRALNPEQAAVSEDKDAIADLQVRYGNGPFLAADAMVQSRGGHIPLIRRGNGPQRGIHALPGGKLDDSETIYQAALRDLKEETGLVAAVDGQIKQIDWDSALAGYVVNDQPDRESARPLDLGRLLLCLAVQHWRVTRLGRRHQIDVGSSLPVAKANLAAPVST